MYKIYYPLYHNFVCKAEDCVRNCCSVYRIPFFRWEEELFSTNPLWSDFNGSGKCISESLLRDETCWRMPRTESGSCMFWRADGLCSLQKKFGQSVLPSVCRTYPRIITEYPDRQEYSLDPCCPEVALGAREWKIGMFVTEGECSCTHDEEFVRRSAALELVCDEHTDLPAVFRELARMYGTGLDVPGFILVEEQESFLRKMTALMIFSILLPHKGHPRTENVMSFILESLLAYIATDMPRTWEELSISFSTFLTDFEIRIGCDDEIEGRYKDVKDFE